MAQDSAVEGGCFRQGFLEQAPGVPWPCRAENPGASPDGRAGLRKDPLAGAGAFHTSKIAARPASRLIVGRHGLERPIVPRSHRDVPSQRRLCVVRFAAGRAGPVTRYGLGPTRSSTRTARRALRLIAARLAPHVGLLPSYSPRSTSGGRAGK